MKKLKVLIASLVGAIALAFAFVVGVNVSAASENIEISYTQLTAWAPSSPKLYDENGVTITSTKRLQAKATANAEDAEGNKYATAGQLENGQTLTIKTAKYTNIKVYSYCKSSSSTINVGGNTYNAAGAFINEFTFTKEVVITTSGSNGAGIYKIVITTGVKALQQEAVTGDYTYVRFLFIVADSTLTSSDFSNKLTLILDEDEATEQTVTRSPKAYDKLTLAGAVYSATIGENLYTFDNSVNTDDIYVVYVVKFTTTKYTGQNVKASLNVGGTEYKTSGYTFVVED